jgi:hypothetical protein
MGANSDGSSIQINGIPVILKNIITGDVLQFNGFNWINAPGSSLSFPDITDTPGVLVKVSTGLQVSGASPGGNAIFAGSSSSVL